MGKGSEQTTTQSQTSTSQPWLKAQPLLENLIGALGGQSTAVTPDQSNALGTLKSAAAGLPSFDTTSAINKMLGFDTAPQVGMLSDAYDTLRKTFAPLTDPNNLDPMKAPGIGISLDTLANDITNRVKGVYAGSGRDPSGAGSFAGSLARGMAQGMAPVLTGQYNTNVSNMMNAANALEGAGVNTAGQITAQRTQPLAEAATALGLIPAATSAQMLPGNMQLTAANTGYQLPYGNINALLGPSVALGSLGSQSSGTGTSTMVKPESTAGNVMGGLMGGVGMLSQMGAFGPAGWLLASDERVKEDVKPIGKLDDGQNVYSFRYADEPVTRIGLLAQEVLEHEPDAVFEMPGGLLMVDHARATRRASEMRRAA